MMNLIRDGQVETRKDHQCFACLETIPKGELVYCQTIADGGEIYTIYTCPECEYLLEKITDNYGDDGEFEWGCVKNSGYPEGYKKGDYVKLLLKKAGAK
jgi:hypothetical protein